MPRSVGVEVEAPRGVMPRDIFTSKRLAEYARFHFSPVRFGACHRCEVLLNDFGCSTTAQFMTSLHPFQTSYIILLLRGVLIKIHFLWHSGRHRRAEELHQQHVGVRIWLPPFSAQILTPTGVSDAEYNNPGGAKVIFSSVFRALSPPLIQEIVGKNGGGPRWRDRRRGG